MIHHDATYGSLEDGLNSRQQGVHLTILEGVYGPRPYWKFPSRNDRIPQRTRVLYVLDQSEPFFLATVRTLEHDRPIYIRNLLFHFEDDICANGISAVDLQKGRISIAVMMERSMWREQLVAKVITHTTEEEDIKDDPFFNSDYRHSPTFPTLYFVDTNYGKVTDINTTKYSNRTIIRS